MGIITISKTLKTSERGEFVAIPLVEGANIKSLPQEIGAIVTALNGLLEFTRAGLEAADYFRSSPQHGVKCYPGSNFRRRK